MWFCLDNENNTKSLEILTIHHAIKGIEELKKLAENLNPFEIQTFQKKILESKPRSFVLNYRFLRKFSNTGEADDWILNGVQHQSGKSMKMMNFLWRNRNLSVILTAYLIIMRR